MSTPAISKPSAAELRLKLAGLADPSRLDGGPGESADLKLTAVRYITILAHLFGDELDRTTLWDRIGSAVETAFAECQGGDLDRWSTLCLEHVQADLGRAAACEALGQVLAQFDARPVEWRQLFMRYIRERKFVVLVKARERWNQVKNGEASL